MYVHSFCKIVCVFFIRESCAAMSTLDMPTIHYATPSPYALPHCTDYVTRQNKLEEYGVKYALQKREASASNEMQSMYV